MSLSRTIIFDLFTLKTPSIGSGIDSGSVVELGNGPGYLGLEWLKKTENTRLSGVDISPAMLGKARANSREYGMEDRTEYIEGNVMKLPFADSSADAVFTNGSLHEWEDADIVLKEVYRVLKPSGELYISDLKRNISSIVYGMMSSFIAGERMKKGLSSSIQAAYVKKELKLLLEQSPFREFKVNSSLFGLKVAAAKQAFPGDSYL